MSAASYPYSQAHAHTVALIEELTALNMPMTMIFDLAAIAARLAQEAEARRSIPPLFDDPLA